MKTVTSKMTFKTVTSKMAERDSRLLSLVNKKRPELSFTFAIPESAAELTAEQFTALVSQFVENYAKAQITANAHDWSFTPTPETCNFSAAWQDFISTASRERTLTKESVAQFASFYKRFSPMILRLSDRQATAAEMVLNNYQKQSNEVAQAMLARLEQFADKLDTDSEAIAELENNAKLLDVMEALQDYFSVQIKSAEEITADAL